MTELLSADQMRAIEQAAIAEGDVTGLELMERAGRGVVSAILAEWSAAEHAQQACVLCGPGNNGGDGFVVARLLADMGWSVTAFLYGDATKLPPDAKLNRDRWQAMGGLVTTLTERTFRKAAGHGIIIDALFGTGITRPVCGEAWQVLSHMAGRNGDDFCPQTVCIDAPSGLCLDSGRLLGQADGAYADGMQRFARLTVTFDSPKLGHFLAAGPALCGKIVIADIGLQTYREQQTNPATGRGNIVRFPETTLISPKRMVPDTRPFFRFDPRRLQKQSGHKYSHGHALILSGGVGKGGAARLAARGAIRVGAGAVTLACPPAALIENAAQLNAIMLRKLKDAAALNDIFADTRMNVLCLGPGLGTRDTQRGLVEVALKSGRHCVLDADALTLIAHSTLLFDLLHDKCVLTPHAGEFARIFPDIAAKLDAPAQTGPAYSKVDATRDAAQRAGCTIVFKGPDTVIADPSGRCSINAAVYDRAAPWLATAGSGDVLAGFVTGLMARGFRPMHAAEAGAWLHQECALFFGPGLIAEDLPEALPQVLRNLIL